MTVTNFFKENEPAFARAGLISKSLVYCLFGIMVCMAAFNLNGQSPSETDKHSLFSFVEKQTGGQVMLIAIALGLVSYCIWRFIQAFFDSENKGTDAQGLAMRARYFLSAVLYTSFIYGIGKMLLTKSKSGGGGSKQNFISTVLYAPFGQLIVGIFGLIIAGVGFYQVYYGLSEKHKKHVNKKVNEKYRKLLLTFGKIGYIARGIVWLLIGFLFGKAAYSANSSKAGDSSKAFQFLSEANYGSILLTAMGLGLICYGLFNMVRARYENFD